MLYAVTQTTRNINLQSGTSISWYFKNAISLKIAKCIKSLEFSPKIAEIPNLGEIPQKCVCHFRIIKRDV